MKWVIIIPVLLLCGCSAAQLRQEFIGYFANDVKNSKNKQVQSLDMSADDCVTKIKDILRDMKAIVRENRARRYIVADNFQHVFRSAIDTTQAGIIVTPKDAAKCDVEVASSNKDLAIFVSKEISKRSVAATEGG